MPNLRATSLDRFAREKEASFKVFCYSGTEDRARGKGESVWVANLMQAGYER